MTRQQQFENLVAQYEYWGTKAKVTEENRQRFLRARGELADYVWANRNRVTVRSGR